jgi:hypothetical protein
MTTHGYTKGRIIPKEFRAWQGMINRCTNKKIEDYKDYGAKGIVICDRWRHSFVAFLEDMGPSPSPTHSLDRYPNNKGNYEPGNVRWATKKEQSRNRSICKIFLYKGEMLHLEDLAKKLHTYPSNITRMLKHKSIEDMYAYYEGRNQLNIINSGRRKRGQYTVNRKRKK